MEAKASSQNILCCNLISDLSTREYIIQVYVYKHWLPSSVNRLLALDFGNFQMCLCCPFFVPRNASPANAYTHILHSGRNALIVRTWLCGIRGTR